MHLHVYTTRIFINLYIYIHMHIYMLALPRDEELYVARTVCLIGLYLRFLLYIRVFTHNMYIYIKHESTTAMFWMADAMAILPLGT